MLSLTPLGREPSYEEAFKILAEFAHGIPQNDVILLAKVVLKLPKRGYCREWLEWLPKAMDRRAVKLERNRAYVRAHRERKRAKKA